MLSINISIKIGTLRQTKIVSCHQIICIPKQILQEHVHYYMRILKLSMNHQIFAIHSNSYLVSLEYGNCMEEHISEYDIMQYLIETCLSPESIKKLISHIYDVSTFEISL